MEPFETLLTPWQQQVLLEGREMIAEGQQLIRNIQQTLSSHLPPGEKECFLKLMESLSEQSMRIGRIKQTIEQIQIMKYYYNGKTTKTDIPAQEAQGQGQATPATTYTTILFGYAEDSGIL